MRDPWQPDVKPYVATVADLTQLLQEPPVRAGHWLPTAYGRLAAAATGPVAVLSPHAGDDGVLRLEAAGWPVLAPEPADGDQARLAARVEEASRAYYPKRPDLVDLAWGFGSPIPALVLVGESTPKTEQRPFLSRSGVWLLRALREAGYDELTLYLVNAYKGKKLRRDALIRLNELFVGYEPTWVALGKVAGRVLRGCEIEHVALDHPAMWRRFRYKLGPQAYADEALKRGLPIGPWKERPLPTRPAGEKPDLRWLDLWHLADSVAHKPNHSQKAGKVSSSYDPIRKIYVLGEAPTLRAACILAGIAAALYPEVEEVARAQGWHEERDDFERDVRAKASAQAAEIEAQAITAIARSTTSIVAGALSMLQARTRLPVDDPRHIDLSPRDALSIAHIGALYDDRRDAALDQEQARLRAMPQSELLRQVAKTLVRAGEDSPEIRALAEKGSEPKDT